MKTFQEAFDIAQQWETDNITSSSALVARALFRHINSLASPQVTDEQILKTWDSKGAASDYYPPGYTLKEHVLRFARALLSAPPAAEKKTTHAGGQSRTSVNSYHASIAAPHQEAKPVAAESADFRYALKQILSYLPIHRDWLDPDIEAYARNLLDAAPQEQAPVAGSALDKEAGECQRVVRTGDQSLTLTFSSCRAASAFEKAIRATPPTWAQSQPQQVTGEGA